MNKMKLDDILFDFKNDFAEKMFDAVGYASRMTQKRIEEKAHKFIDQYYDEYKPKKYNRVPGRQLHKLVEPIYEVEKTKTGKIYKFGIKYDPVNIEGIYFSNSSYHKTGNKWVSVNNELFDFDSGDNGIPEPNWITTKFFNGIHPGYLYDYETGDVIKKHVRKKSPNTKMQQYFDKEISGIIGNYYNDFLLHQLKMYF